MPIIPAIPGVTFEGLSQTAMHDPDIAYDYPLDLDFHPESDLHRETLTRLIGYAQDSSTAISSNYEDWERLDKVVSAYVYEPTRSTTEGKSTRALQNVEVVLPISYAQLETLLTYMAAAFWKDPIFPYRGTGPEDAFGALMLEKVIHNQTLKNSVGLALHTQWRDNFIYGFGAVTPYWKKIYGSRTITEEEQVLNIETGLFTPTGQKVKKRVHNVLKSEGSAIDNIDPYCFLPDPRASVHDLESAEYCGWIAQDTYLSMITEEESPDSDLFNVRYLNDGVDQFSSIASSKYRREKAPRRESATNTSNSIDVLWMYVYLIPSEWNLGDVNKVELWLFGVVGDRLIVHASKEDNDHGLLPVAVCATNFDGYSATPQSQIGTIFGLQEILDFLYNSHIINIRKAINDILVVDPQLVSMKDVQNPAPGKVIRLRRTAWGKNLIDSAIKQLDVRDVTSGHIDESDYIINLMGHATGGNSLLQGAMQPRTSRISASESNNLQSNSFSRLEMQAQIIDKQSHSKLSHIFASNAVQYMEENTYVRVVGELAQQLQDDFNVAADRERVRVSPLDLVVDYDIEPHDGKIPGSQNAQTWIEVMQIAGQVPQIVDVLNWPNLFKHVARMLGVTNVDDFVNSGASLRLAPDDVVAREAQAGNIRPVGTPSANGAQ